MFSSSSLDKNCINSDSCSSSRNNAPNRFSVGIAPLGDENQQIRIQLAVHKYNGTTGRPFNNRCSFMSPIRHSFLKNSLKVRNYEGDYEGTSKIDKRNGNQYEGVGAFPTIHLKKNALRYRPIRRFHDVKIPYPELPVNRFLSHLPEVCPDLKSSTRSFLDVLEDLSENKIQSKDDNGCSKPKHQGLGGDYLLNPNSVFKPLFVQKPKLNAILTRDSTTQTLSPISTETPSPQGASSSQVRNGPADPRAELRRKLAKQNNEIFASLSSSISSAFCLKRKLDKVLPSKDDGQLGEGSALKKTKMSDHRHRESNEIGLAKPGLAPAVNSSESVKLNKKSKISDTNSVSPNKDRLTKIFLDTQNTSPKARMFQANTSSESKFTEKGSQVANISLSETNGESADKAESPLASSFVGGQGRNERTQSSVNFTSSQKSDKQELGPSDKPVAGSLTSKSNMGTKEAAQFSASPLQLSATATHASNFTSPKTFTGNISYSSEPSKSVPGNGNDLEKKEMSKGFSFGKADEKTIFGPFKFGVGGSTPLPQNKVFTDLKETTAEPAAAANVEPSNSTTQFSLSTTSSVTASPRQTSAFCFGAASSQNTSTSHGKNTFTFGHAAPSSQQTSTNAQETSTTATSSAITTPVQTTHPVTFAFGQKPIVSSAPSPAAAVSVAAGLNKNCWSSTGTSGPVFGSEQKQGSPVTSAGPAPVVQEQVKTSPFIFGQRETEGESGQKSANVFSSEQKPMSQPSTASTDAAAPNQPSAAHTNQPFAQVASAATAAPQVTITQTSVSQASTIFGPKFEGSSSKGFSAPELSSGNSSFLNKTGSFKSSVNAFGKTTAPTTAGFTTSTSSAPAFGFQVPATAQSVPPFGSSAAIQSAPTFGSSSTTQSAPTFGSSSTTQSAPIFKSSSTTQSSSTFGSSSTTQSSSTFGSTLTTQSAPTFGSSSTTQSAPTFGSSSTTQSAPTFGSSSTTQSTPTFGSSSTTQSAPTFGSSSTTQSAPTFGSSSTTQSTPTFGSSSTTQSAPTFGSSSTTQSTPTFGSSSTTQSAPIFGSSSATQSASIFGSSSISQPAPTFGSSATTQSASTFGSTSTSQPAPIFGSSSATQSITSFATAPASQAAPAFRPPASHSTPGFVVSPTTQTPPTFGSPNKHLVPPFGTTSTTLSSQPPFAFGTSPTTQTTPAPLMPFKLPASSSTSMLFGTQTSTQAPVRFGPPATQTNGPFQPSPAFPASPSLDNKPGACPSSSNMFPQNSSPAFSSSNVFTSNQNIFAQKPPAETAMLEQNKAQAPGFGSSSQVFGAQNKFSFGAATSTTSPPTTAPMAYSFGGGTTGNTFTFGGHSSAPNCTQTPFAFGSAASEPFKFGATTAAAATSSTTTTTTSKGGGPFGGGPSGSFSFGGQMSNPPVAEQKPSFNFQASGAAPGFHFGTTPSPSVFNFGGSSSSGSSGSNFSFGTPTGGVGFGQSASPGTPFAVPGTFNIGSGSSQSRPRASSRPRRRP